MVSKDLYKDVIEKIKQTNNVNIKDKNDEAAIHIGLYA